MTKKELYRELRSTFFVSIEGKFPNTTIDSEYEGIWKISMENGLIFELSNINFGGDVLGYELNNQKINFKLSEKILRELADMWESTKQLFPDLYN